jgi:hypothetical protein
MYLPHSVVASPAACVEEELPAFPLGPELLGELDEDLGVDCHVELVDRQNLPVLNQQEMFRLQLAKPADDRSS